MTNNPAATQNELIEPILAMSPAPIAGPNTHATPMKPSCIPLRRSRSTPDAVATSGSIVFLAVYPAGSNTAPVTAIRSIERLDNPNVIATIGNAATESAESRSAPILTARRPM